MSTSPNLVSFQASAVAELWWQLFREAHDGSHGQTFRLQADLSRDTLAATLRRLGVAADADRLCEAQFAFWRRPPFFGDSLPFLREIDVPVCLVFNIDRDDLDAAMTHHGFDVAAVVTSQDARAYKPRPEPFERAMTTLGVTPSDVLHVGDSLSADVAGAEALGIRSAWINRSGRPLPAGPTPTYVVDILTDLLPLLQSDARPDRPVIG